jgi:aminoglycoside phosphotransferase (APT) family kinase protein
MNQQVIEILTSHFPGRDWALRTSTEGMSSKSYIATGGDLQLFIKINADTTALRHVAELGIAPRVLAEGTQDGSRYVVQEFLHGTHPDRPWFSRHLPELANLIQVYHLDQGLAALLGKGQTLAYQEHLDGRLNELGVQLASLEASSHKAELTPLLAELRDQARTFESAGLVPTHADPNNNNFLLVGDKIYLLDWDGVSLSDPIRDVGPMLWWYVPAETWPEFFAAFHVEWSKQIEHKVYWWAAWQSCWVALLFATAGYPESAEPFIIDFRAALHGQPNPHA